MSAYDFLIGQSFSRHGIRYTVVKCEGATVIAGYLEQGRVRRMLVPLGEVVKSLEVTEIELTEPPPPPPVRARPARPRKVSSR